ncbi:hypothetical protein N2152v2_007191 [Parachlorella kessleri]
MGKHLVTLRSWGLSVKAVVAELMAMCLFVFIGTGTATTFASIQGPGGFELGKVVKSTGDVGSDTTTLSNNILTNPSWGIITALAFGLGITGKERIMMAYATGHLSGGQLNPAVTLGLALTGSLPPLQAVANVLAQIVGAILGSSFLYGVIPNSSNSSLGSNKIAHGVSVGNAFLGEAVMTFVLVSVVLETAVSKKSITVRAQAPLAIGFAVFTAHAVSVMMQPQWTEGHAVQKYRQPRPLCCAEVHREPIDGCSINPARSLGPAIVTGTWPGSFWVFIVGPLVGSLFAVPFHLFYRSDFDTNRSKDPISLSTQPTGVSSDVAAAIEALPQASSTAQVVQELNLNSPKATTDTEGGKLSPAASRV